MDKIKDIDHENGQWYLPLAALTCDESQDNVTGAGYGMARQCGENK